MNSEKILTVLESPYVSEKASLLAANFRQYAFRVQVNATKPEIKKAVEQLFNVKVRAVRICNVKGKNTRFKQVLGKRKSWKKAYVTLTSDSNVISIGE